MSGRTAKTYEHVVGLFGEHMSDTTNTVHMLFSNCVKYDKCTTNMYMLFENSVTYNRYDYNIYMLF